MDIRFFVIFLKISKVIHHRRERGVHSVENRSFIYHQEIFSRGSCMCRYERALPTLNAFGKFEYTTCKLERKIHFNGHLHSYLCSYLSFVSINFYRQNTQLLFIATQRHFDKILNLKKKCNGIKVVRIWQSFNGGTLFKERKNGEDVRQFQESIFFVAYPPCDTRDIRYPSSGNFRLFFPVLSGIFFFLAPLVPL